MQEADLSRAAALTALALDKVLFVCVNTDDAGIMPTTIQNEYAVLEKTASQVFGVGSAQARTW